MRQLMDRWRQPSLFHLPGDGPVRVDVGGRAVGLIGIPVEQLPFAGEGARCAGMARLLPASDHPQQRTPLGCRFPCFTCGASRRRAPNSPCHSKTVGLTMAADAAWLRS